MSRKAAFKRLVGEVTSTTLAMGIATLGISLYGPVIGGVLALCWACVVIFLWESPKEIRDTWQDFLHPDDTM